MTMTSFENFLLFYPPRGRNLLQAHSLQMICCLWIYDGAQTHLRMRTKQEVATRNNDQLFFFQLVLLSLLGSIPITILGKEKKKKRRKQPPIPDSSPDLCFSEDVAGGSNSSSFFFNNKFSLLPNIPYVRSVTFLPS